MKTYEVVREVVKLMDDDQPKQKAILWDAFTKLFDLMVEEYEKKPKKATAAAVKAPKPKAKRGSIDWGKAEACWKAGWDYKKIADELGCSYHTIYNHFNEKEVQ